jgi:glucosylceramidase
MLFKDLNHWVRGWVDWNMVLDMTGGPSWTPGRLSSPIIVNATAKEYQKEPIFYILGHFSKFLVPDSVRIELKMQSKIDKLYATAFERPDKQIVLIVANMNNEEIQLNINEPKSGHLNTQISAHSIQSYIWK